MCGVMLISIKNGFTSSSVVFQKNLVSSETLRMEVNGANKCKGHYQS